MDFNNSTIFHNIRFPLITTKGGGHSSYLCSINSFRFFCLHPEKRQVFFSFTDISNCQKLAVKKFSLAFFFFFFSFISDFSFLKQKIFTHHMWSSIWQVLTSECNSLYTVENRNSNSLTISVDKTNSPVFSLLFFQ